MQEESGQESGGEGCDALFQPSSLLTGLPSLACVQLLQALVASGSRQLTELMTACKATRSMVVQHAPRIRFTEHGPSQVASMAHAALHAAATRSGCDLELVFNFQGVTGRASALLSAAATQGISPSNAGAGSPAGRGCCAVHSLTIKSAGEDQWGHLVGWAAPNMTALTLNHLNTPASLLTSLAACPQLAKLDLCMGVVLTPDVLRDMRLLPFAAPNLRTLRVWLWDMLPVVEALSQQLTSLEVYGEMATSEEGFTAHPGPLPVLAQCTQLQKLAVLSHVVDDAWLEAMLGLTNLKEVELWRVVDLATSFAHRHAPWDLVIYTATCTALPKLPLGALATFTCNEFLVTVDREQDVQVLCRTVAAGAQALGVLTKHQFPQDTLGVRVTLEGDTEEEGSAGNTPLPPETARAVLAALSNSMPDHVDFRVWLYFDAGVLEEFGAAELRAVAGDALGARLCELGIEPHARVGADFWGALLPCFPKLNALGFQFGDDECFDLSPADLAVFVVMCPRAVGVYLHNTTQQAREAAEQAKATVRAQGRDTKAFVCITS